ncbi:NAD-dependent protein deacylase SRT2 [Zea mays]|nr:NAD-dependent protein deacylase SRT2 [Zea mays]
MVVTGAGMSTESGIPDYRSPNGAYSTGLILNHFLIRLHHRAGSNPLELHGSVYEVICLECLNVVHPSVENHSRRNVVNNTDPCWKLEIYHSHVRCWVGSSTEKISFWIA